MPSHTLAFRALYGLILPSRRRICLDCRHGLFKGQQLLLSSVRQYTTRPGVQTHQRAERWARSEEKGDLLGDENAFVEKRDGKRDAKRRRPSSLEVIAAERASKPKEDWQVQKSALKKKFGDESWNPRKRLSPDAIEGIRTLHAQYPDRFTTPILAKQFEVSPEVIRRILKSKWRPSEEEHDDRRKRWDKRGEKIWTSLADLGVRPPKKWRTMGIGRVKEGEGVPRWKRPRWREINKSNTWTRGRNAVEMEKIKAGMSIAARIL